MHAQHGLTAHVGGVAELGARRIAAWRVVVLPFMLAQAG
jgi:hypothetical protein